MTDVLQSPRRLYLCFAYAFVAGAVCALYNCFAGCLAIDAALASVLAHGSRIHLHAGARTWIIILLVPLVAFASTRWRLSICAGDPLAKYDGRSVILVGRLSEKSARNTAGTAGYLIDMEKIIFPESKRLHAKTTLYVSQTASEKISEAERPGAGLTLSKSVMIRATIRVAKEQHGRVLVFCANKDITICDTTVSPREDTLQNRLTEAVDLLLERARKLIVATHIAAIDGEPGSLLSSMVLGDKAIKLSQAIVDDFRTIGLSHILAASGFNLTLVITMSYFLAASVLHTEKQRSLVAFSLMIFFVLLAGFSASIVRAAIMSTFLITSRLLRRQCHITAVIATAILLTIIVDPHAILDLGLQLSYAATLGITLAAQPLAELIQFTPTKFGKMAADLCSACIIAQLAVLPIQVFAFCNANVLFLVANILVLPCVAPITVVGFVSSLIALTSILVPGATELTAQACGALDAVVRLPLLYVLFVSHNLASLQWAKLNVGKPDVLQVAIYYLCFALFVVAIKRHWHKIVAFSLMAAGVWVLMVRPQASELSVGLFKNGTVLINSERDAVIMPVCTEANIDQSLSKDTMIRKFLASSAVRDSLVATRTTAGPQTIHAVKILHKDAEDSSFFVCTDRSRRLGVLYFAAPPALHSALNDSSFCLGALQNTETRILIIRIDADKTSTRKHQPERIFRDLSHVMSACAIERAVLVFDNRQLLCFRPLLQFIRSDAGGTKGEAMALTTANRLQALTLTRNQMAGQEKNCTD